MGTMIDFGSHNFVLNPLSGEVNDPISPHLFGAINLSTGGEVGGIAYSDLFTKASDMLSIGFVRYPDGEMPDGFAREKGDGSWGFQHNKLNGGSSVFVHPDTGVELQVGEEITQELLDSLTPAFSLSYPDLVHPNLLVDPATGGATGRMGLSDSLAHAYEIGVPFALVLPEFQYLKPPVNRDPEGDGSLRPFVAEEHVQLERLKEDVYSFLKDLFVNGKYNDGVLPEPMLIELGNEDFFGWNANYASKDSNNDLDSYSAFVQGCLSAIDQFRSDFPGVDFKVSMQAHGKNFVNEVLENLSDEGAEYLLTNIDVIDTIHIGLDATVERVSDLESEWTILTGISELLEVIDSLGGDGSVIEVYASAWSATSNGVEGYNGVSHTLPAGAAALSLFSSFFELGVDYAALWGIGAWDGFATNAVDVSGGEYLYSPYAEVLRLMAESLGGTTQIITDTMDANRDVDHFVYAFQDDAKGVIFVASNGSALSETIDLNNFGNVAFAWLERVSTVTDEAGNTRTVITREPVEVVENSLTVTFNNPHETVRIIVARENPGNGFLHLWGSDENDTLVGGTSDDLLEGNHGDDILIGNGGNDTIIAGAGSDELQGGAGDDLLLAGFGGSNILDGGMGKDTLSYEGSDNGVNFWFQEGLVETEEGQDTITNIERFVGSSHDDRMNVVFSNGLTIEGGAGDDRFFENGSSQIVSYLGSGEDTYIGFGDSNQIFGGAGDDRIQVLGKGNFVDGGAGNDYILSGPWSSEFYFSLESDHDTVSGFLVGKDQLVFSPDLFEKLLNGEFSLTTAADDTKVEFGGSVSITFLGLSSEQVMSVLDAAIMEPKLDATLVTEVEESPKMLDLTICDYKNNDRAEEANEISSNSFLEFLYQLLRSGDDNGSTFKFDESYNNDGPNEAEFCHPNFASDILNAPQSMHEIRSICSEAWEYVGGDFPMGGGAGELFWEVLL